VKLLVWTRDDPASFRIAQALLTAGHFPDDSGDPTARTDGALGAVLARIEGSLLSADFADRSFGAPRGQEFERALFLSKHSAASGLTAFTVHPIGNLGGEAKFGGAPRTLAPSDGAAQTSLLRALTHEAGALGIQAAFEATHHGPQMDIPSLFVEVGSAPKDWENTAYCAAVARAIVAGYLRADLEPAAPACLGLGGGHYHPKHTDRARRDGTAFGHLVPGYALGDLRPETLERAVALSGAAAFAVDPNGAPQPALDEAVARLVSLGLTDIALGG
jgi:D-aminoacyl-tRNA deacylase